MAGAKADQGDAKEPPRPGVVTLGNLPSRVRDELIRARLLAVVAKAHNRCRMGRAPGPGLGAIPPENYWFARGYKPYWAARQLVGGRVRADEFRRAADTLIEAGELVELWADMEDGRGVTHGLALPGAWRSIDYRIVQARGRVEVLAKEVWFPALYG